MKIAKLRAGSLTSRQPLVMSREDSEALDCATTVRGWSAYMTMGIGIVTVKPCVTTHLTPEMAEQLEQRARKEGLTILELLDRLGKEREHGQ